MDGELELERRRIPRVFIDIDDYDGFKENLAYMIEFKENAILNFNNKSLNHDGKNSWLVTNGNLSDFFKTLRKYAPNAKISDIDIYIAVRADCEI